MAKNGKYEWSGGCLIVHDAPWTYRCEQEGDLVHVTRVNEQTGDELLPIDLKLYELPGSIHEEFKKRYGQFNR